jgi:uncharacterized protein
MRAVWLAALTCLALLVGASRAQAAFAVPPIQGHVTDTAGALQPAERTEVEQRLTQWMDRSGVEIAVFVVGSLEGETIEDVAYRTFNTWRIGREKLDNGVLLVIAPRERRLRIETGKGVGGQLTDLQASDIIEHRIAPRLREGHLGQAIDEGADAIALALASGPSAPVAQGPPPWMIGLALLFIIGVGVLRMWIGGPLFWLGGGGRGGGSRGGGGGGYSGGGGRSGGGGASGRW